MTISNLERENLFLKEENVSLKQQNLVLQFRLAQLEKTIFGAKRERFVPQISDKQISIFNQGEPEPDKGEDEPTPDQTKPSAGSGNNEKKKRKINRNTFPTCIPRVEQIIQPSHYQDGFTKIGQDETEILKYTPMQLEVLKIIRPRYVDNSATEKNIHQANIPARIIPKGLVDDSLVAGLITEKFEHHMPIYRFVKKLRNAGIDFIKSKHCYNYVAKAGEALQPIHDLMHQEMLASDNVQMDESSLRVLSQDKEHGKLRGCMWVMNAPGSNLVLFNYRPSKEKEHAYELLNGYQGILQADGYATYQGIADAPNGTRIQGKYTIQIDQFLNCWAHTRRKFYEAKDLDPALIDPILLDIQKLYLVERQAREQNMDAEQRHRLRQQKSIPVLEAIKKKLDEASLKNNLTGPVRVAFGYAIKRWPQLNGYTNNGNCEIDTNLLENKIRLLALGRKNYLFAKSDQTAQYIATFYSIVATCQINGIDTFKYLCWLLKKVTTEKITSDAVDWLPHRIDPILLE